MSLSAWRIGDDGPERIRRTQIDLERSLKDWIGEDPVTGPHSALGMAAPARFAADRRRIDNRIDPGLS